MKSTNRLNGSKLILGCVVIGLPAWPQDATRPFPEINARAAISVAREPYAMLGGKNQYDEHSTFSTAKIMTALLALESGKPLEGRDGTATIGYYASRASGTEGVRRGGSLMSIDGKPRSDQEVLEEGERASLRALLYGLLLPSGNNAARAIAEFIEGCVSTEARGDGPRCVHRFVHRMNNRRESLCRVEGVCLSANTQFQEPHGNSFSTPSDLAKLTDFALRNPIFAEIVRTHMATVLTSMNGATKSYRLRNRNKLINQVLADLTDGETENDPYPGAIGVKTGTAGERANLVSAAKLLGKTVVAVTMESPATSRYADNKAVLDHAFDALFQITRAGDSGSYATLVSPEIAMTALSGSRVVTAVEDSEGDLRLISWLVTERGLSREVNSVGTGRASEITIDKLSGTRAVTAVRDSRGNLKLTSWNVTATDVGQLGSSGSYGTSGTGIAMRALGNNRAITVMRDGGGSMRMDTWMMNFDGSWNRQDFLVAEERISHADLTARCAMDRDGGATTCRVVTAITSQRDRLKVISWDVNERGSIFRAGESAEEPWGGPVTIDYDPLLSIYVTAGNDSTQNLKLITWKATADSRGFWRLSDSGDQAGRASLIRMAGIMESGVVTAVRDSAGRQIPILWGFDGYGRIKRVDDGGRHDAIVTGMAVCARLPNRFLTAVRVNGGLRVVSWKVDTAR